MWKNLCLLAILAWTAQAFAGAKVTGLEWVPGPGRGRFVVLTQGVSTEAPDWSVKGGRLSMVLPGASLEKGIVRYVGGIRLAAANVSNGVLTTLTFLNGGAISPDQVSLNLGDGRVEVVTQIPAGFMATAAASAPAATSPTQPVKITQGAGPAPSARKPAITKDDLGEDFLKRLETEEKTPAAAAKPIAPAPIVAHTAPVNVLGAKVEHNDEINTTQSAAKRSDGFSIATYAGKFVAFLGVVLLFFWGVVQMMKKGVLSKGKLGFLNGSSLVSVLSTTYVAPKRSLLLVKAHNQVFLVASSEAGFEFLSEVRDVPGVMKEGERFITGQNFDDIQINEERAPAKEVKMKEDIYQSTPVEDKAAGKVNKDIARFSDELKKKVKNLKTLQQ